MRNLFGAILLLAGTCIGAGMLALPVSTSPVGFFMSLGLLIIAWSFMCYTGFLVVEANLWFPDGTNYISMAKKTLGKAGGAFAWIAFLLLLYCLMAAYITGGGALVLGALKQHGIIIKSWHGYIPWIVVFALIIYAGTQFADIINRLLMLGLIVTYAALSASAVPHMKLKLLLDAGHAKYLLAALPVLLASFGYHIVLPSMRTYLKGRVTLLRLMVLLGSMLPLVIYIGWIFVIFSVVPREGRNGLINILQSGQATLLLTKALVSVSQSTWLAYVARFFAFFAIASSFVGVSLGLFDLLADGLKVKRNHLGKTFVAMLTFVPPLIFAIGNPNGFILALSYAGVFVALLHGILPAAMVWSGRYLHDVKSDYRVWGGRFLLCVIFLISLLVIYAQVGVNLGWVPVK